MGQWQQNLCGWGETPRGTVACISNRLTFPEEPGEITEPPTPSRVLHLPEPPMRFGTLEDDDSDSDMLPPLLEPTDESDNESVDSMGFPRRITDLDNHFLRRQDISECTICCGEFTDGIKHSFL